MAVSLSSVKVGIEGKDDTKAATSSAKKNVSSFTETVKDNAAEIIAAAIAAKKLMDMYRSLTDAYKLQENANIRLATLMSNVKGTTQENINAIADYAAELQNLTTISADVTQAGASQLSTFMLQAESIKALIPAMQDLAVASYGQNVQQEQMIQSANLMGKVFSGQIGALTRVGVSFTAAQGEMLKTGSEIDRVNTLVQVLNDNFGGLAESMTDSLEGGRIQLKNQIDEYKKIIATALAGQEKEWNAYWIDVLKRNAEAFKDFTVGFGSIIAITKQGFQSLWVTIKQTLLVFKSMFDYIATALHATAQLGIKLLNPFNWLNQNGSIQDALGEFNQLFQDAWQNIVDTSKTAAKESVTAWITDAAQAIEEIRSLAQNVGTIGGLEGKTGGTGTFTGGGGDDAGKEKGINMIAPGLGESIREYVDTAKAAEKEIYEYRREMWSQFSMITSDILGAIASNQSDAMQRVLGTIQTVIDFIPRLIAQWATYTAARQAQLAAETAGELALAAAKRATSLAGLGLIGLGIGAITAAVGFFNRSKGAESKDIDAPSTSSTDTSGSRSFTNVVRRAPQTIIVSPTFSFIAENGLQNFGDREITNGSLVNLFRESMITMVRNNDIDLGELVPVGEG